MNETITTIVGNVVDEPNRRRLESGVSVTSFRIASTARRFDRATSHWTDGESLYLKVTCWRALAENVYRSFVKGDPVVITGRLFTRLYEVGESRRAAYELEATAAGFDLNRGVSTFKRVSNRGTTVDEVGVDGLPSGGAVDAHLEAARAAEGTIEVPVGVDAPAGGELAPDGVPGGLQEPRYGDDPFGPDSRGTEDSGDTPDVTDAVDVGEAEGSAAEGADLRADEQADSASGVVAAVGRAAVPTTRRPSTGRRRGAAPALA